MPNINPDQFIYPNILQDFLSSGKFAGLAGVLLVVYVLAMLVYSMLGLISYVLHSLGLYTIAKRRGIHNSWLAWIPLGDLWMLGSVSDQYQYVVKGKIRNRRKVMLWLSIAPVPTFLIWIVLLAASRFTDGGFLLGVVLAVGVLALSAMAIIVAVTRYIAYYNLFASCNRENATLYLVLGIFFPVTLPFFVFACRKKDLGMPPRKQSVPCHAPVQIAEEASEEPVEESATEEEPAVEEAEPVEENPEQPGTTEE